jgi:hypothetical protein
MYGRPPPQTTSDGARAWVRALLPLGTVICLGVLGLMTLQELRTPPSMTVSSAAPAAVSASASPFVVQFPDTMTLITHTPEPTVEPTPTYAMLPTPKPIDICHTATPKGSVCKQPEAPLPSPTPIRACPVKADDPCVYGGGDVRYLPTPTPSMGYGSTN